MATHSSILAWRIPWTEEPGGPQSMGSHRVGRDVHTQPHQQARSSPSGPPRTSFLSVWLGPF